MSLAQHSPPPTGKSATCSPQGVRGTPPVVILPCSTSEWLLTGYSIRRWVISKAEHQRPCSHSLPLGSAQVLPAPTKGASTHAGILDCPHHHTQCPLGCLPILPLLDLLPTIPTGPLGIGTPTVNL